LALGSGQLTVAIDDLPESSFHGTCFRHQAVRWQFSQPGAGARTLGGRWNPPGSFATLYLAESVEIAAAELRRLADRQGREISDFMPRHLLEYRVALSGLLDVTNSDAQSSVELTTAELGGDELGPCQAVGEAAHHLGREGVIAPSAAADGRILAVFVERLRPDSRLDVVATTDWSPS
jgi:RES domain-containing protein